MPRRPVPLDAVRTLFLQRQHLTRPRSAALSPGRLRRFVEDVGGLQLDSINVLDRAHYLTVWSRFGPYDPARLDRAVWPGPPPAARSARVSPAAALRVLGPRGVPGVDVPPAVVAARHARLPHAP